MITFVPQFLSEDFRRMGRRAAHRALPPAVTIADVADHIEHARTIAGLEHIGLGGDFDGTDIFPEGLDGRGRLSGPPR